MKNYSWYKILIGMLFMVLVGCESDSVEKNEKATTAYNISGSISTESGDGLMDVSISYNNTESVVTNFEGLWSLSDVTGELTIIPVKENYAFTPSQIVVNSSTIGANFLATRLTREQDKIVNWFNNLQLSNGLLESAENSDFVSLYDQSLSALVFLSQGNIENAENVFNFFNDRIDTEFLVGNGGFSQFRNRDGTPKNDHRWMGDNAWLLIALNNYKSLTGNNTYDRLSDEIENWLRSLQDIDGGLWAGYGSNDEFIANKVTEGIIDAYNAVPGYDSFHRDLLQYLEDERWDPQDNNLVAWPGNNQYFYAMDLHPWGYSIFEDFPASVLTSAERYLTTQMATANGIEITGYCFDIDNDTVWLEGTGEMIVAFNSAGMESEAAFYLGEMEKMILDSELFEESAGIPYATNRATGYGSGDLWLGVDTNAAISSSAWYLFGKTKFDPLAVGREKNAPIADKFWE